MAPVQAGPLQTLQRAHHHRVAASCSPRQQSVAAAAPSSRRPDLWHYPAATAGIAALPCRSAGAASSFRSNKARSSVATCAAPQAVQVLELQPATQQQPAEPPDSSLVRGPLPSARPAAPVLNLTPETFSSTLQQDAFVLVDFYTVSVRGRLARDAPSVAPELASESSPEETQLECSSASCS